MVHLFIYQNGQVLTKQFNINFLERVDTAELVEFMVDFVENESLVIVCCVILDYIID